MTIGRIARRLRRLARPGRGTKAGVVAALSTQDVADSLRPGPFRALLHRHVIDPWFPRSLDLRHGGFLCDFDHRWRPAGRHDKQLEFQTRQTWAAAELLAVAPGDARLLQAAAHGFDCLQNMMWDHVHGGWFARVSRDGAPLDGGAKHVHGMAYAISACIAVHKAIGTPGALELAGAGFAWMDAHAHDGEHGGYFGPMRREGAILLEPPEGDNPARLDPLGNPYGLKEANIHSDLIDTLALLAKAVPGPLVEARLDELIAIVGQRMTDPSGVMSFLFRPDWTIVPHLVRYGFPLQTAGRLLALPALAGREDLIALAERLVRAALRHGWDDRHGGFFFAGPSAPPFTLDGADLVIRSKHWWVQLEGLKAFAALARHAPEPEPYLRLFTAQRLYIERALVDRRHGGVHPSDPTALPRRARNRLAKGNAWKDCSHEARAFLYCLEAWDKVCR